MKTKKIVALNIGTSIILQLVQITSVLIVPRLIIQTFGSEVNGLISSLNQFLNYIAIVEGGVASVMLANLYKPLLKKDIPKLSEIFNAMLKFFKQISMIFIVYQFILACVYPFFVESSFSWWYIFSLTFLTGFSLFVKYNLSIAYRLLLNAANKIYLISITQIIVVLLTIVSSYAIIYIYPNIHIFKFVTGIVVLIQPLSFHYFVHRYFKLDSSVKPSTKILKQRWNGFAINIASFIRNNTDIVILTLFSSFNVVSIYSVYLMVFQGVMSIHSAFTSSFTPILGKKIVSDDKKALAQFFDIYEYIVLSAAFILFGLSLIIIIPFMTWYTIGINDADYIVPEFATVFCVSHLILCAQSPYINFEYNANKFKDISIYAYMEALINIIISVSLVHYFGLVGVATGTLLAVIYKGIVSYRYMLRNLLLRSTWPVIKIWCVGVSSIIASYVIMKAFTNYSSYHLSDLLLLGVISMVILVVLYTLLSYVFLRKELLNVISFILPKLNSYARGVR